MEVILSFKKFNSIDYNFHSTFVLICILLFISVSFLIFLIFGLESEKYPLSKISILVYIFSGISVIYTYSLLKRNQKINKILNINETETVVISRIFKMRNDQLRLYLKSQNQLFICSIRRTKKNKNHLEKTLLVGKNVRIKNIKREAILIDYYK